MKTTNRILQLSCFILSGMAFLNLSCQAQDLKKQNLEIFQIVWETVNDHFYDPDFGGVDWKEQYEKYKPLVASCQSNDSLYWHLNKMVFELNVSHLGVVPPEEVNDVGDPQLFFDGTLGMDIRILNDKVVITRIESGSSAEKAGLKAGAALLEIDGITIDSIIKKRKSFPTPPFNDRNLRSLITQKIMESLYGEPGTAVGLKYVDLNGIQKEVKLTMQERSFPKAFFMPGLPEIYASVKRQVFENQIAYVKFDVFHPVLLDTLVSIVRETRELPAMIIDLRGNPGGDFNTRRTLASQFVSQRTLFWKYRSRTELREVYLDPPDIPFEGKLVILVDELSASSSEEFSGGLQAIGRAIIVGQQTPGKVLTMEVVPLPNGAIMIYPNQQTMTAKGEILEGRGVVPDIEVALEPHFLSNGIDSQLEKAIEFLKE